MSKQKRYKPEVRKDLVITAALDLAERGHFLKLTRAAIAQAAGVTGSAIQYHFHTMDQLRGDVMRAAIKQERIAVVAQGMTCGERHAAKVPAKLRAKVMAWASEDW